MDRSRALNSLAEAADLTRMVEELLNQAQPDRILQTVGGIRVTLRNLRESISDAHDTLARELVQSARRSAAPEEARSSYAAPQRANELEGITTRSVLLDNSARKPEARA